MSEAGSDIVTPELALVDPELAKAQRQIPERKAAMSSTPPSNGAFFVDPAQPAPPPVNAEPALVPPAEPAPLAAPVPPPVAVPAPAPAPVAALSEDSATSMRDVPLGTLVFRAGLLAEEQLEDALQEGMRTGKRLGEVLLERGWLHERDLGRLLAGQKGLPFVEVSAADAEPAALQLLPEEKARLQIALPLRQEDGQLVVAVADPSNELVLENLRRTFGYEPRLVVAPQGDLIRAITEAYGSAGTQQPLAQPEPQALVPPAPEAEVQPEPQPAPLAAPEPEPQVEPVLEAEPLPTLQQEPVHVEPVAPPAVAPMPTVVPPAEDRMEPPAIAPLQPLVTEPVEHVLEQPPPMAPTLPPVEETPALQPEPQPEQPVLQPEPLPAPVPELPVQPEVEAEPLAPEPTLQPLVPPAAEQPMETVAPPPAEPVPAPGVHQVADSGSMSIHVVLLRLRDGEALDVGTFHTAAEASARAQEVVAQIAAAEGQATWPFFGQRYLRPDAISSVDLLEEPADKWLGSAVRSRWANPA